MRSIILSIMILAGGATTAFAEQWRSREGPCGDWRAVWNLQQGPEGVWEGTIDYEHVGGPCAQLTLLKVRGEIRAVIAGNQFFAARQDVGGQDAFCSFYGRIEGRRVQGVKVCEGFTKRQDFVLRFPRSDRDPSSGTKDDVD